MDYTLDVLKMARGIIALPEHWTQQASARDIEGVPVHVNSSKAYCFCSTGAIQRAAEIGGVGGRLSAAWVLGEVLSSHKTYHPAGDFSQIIAFNDERDLMIDLKDDLPLRHAKVLALFDAAIAKLEGVSA